MVFVKVRETYDLATTRNKMTVISVHTPEPTIIKRNFPGLLMQCKAYRPYSCDIRIACASLLPSDPQGVGLAEGDVAPEDMFNPILYSAMSNFGMSQLEARIASLRYDAGLDVAGSSSDVQVDNLTTMADEFPIYYGILSNAHGWKHASPQAGLEMNGLVPLVYEVLYNVGDQASAVVGDDGNYNFAFPDKTGAHGSASAISIRGNSKRLPMINCTSYTGHQYAGVYPGFQSGGIDIGNAEETVPWINAVVAGIIIPPSRLHQLFYRMIVEWTIEFSGIRPISEITNWSGLSAIGNAQHYQNYDYSATKQAVTGTDDTILDSDQAMVSANVDIKKVM